MKRTFKRMRHGFERIIDIYTYNLVRGFRNVLHTTNNIQHAIKTVVSDALEDIDRRLNRSQRDPFLDQEEEQGPSEDNLLVSYCFGAILGPNYGMRTLLEYEEECQIGTTCVEDIENEAGDDSEEDGFDSNRRGNRHILNKGYLTDTSILHFTGSKFLYIITIRLKA